MHDILLADTLPPVPDLPDLPLSAVERARERLGDRVRETPVWRWQGGEPAEVLGPDTEVWLKLELFQHAGSFKTRGALLNMLSASPETLERGVTAVSAGNHAMAVAYAARSLGTTAKVVMPRSADPYRVAGSEGFGAEVVLVDDVHQAFDEVRRIEREEGRLFVHPFEGEATALGTATVGLELARQVPGLDAVIVPVGGGGLAAGVATAVRHASPETEVYGVEPEGADTMHRSFRAGSPQSVDRVDTLADSLGAPHAAPFSFGLCRRHLAGLAKVGDDELLAALARMFRSAKLAVEPAGAAAAAALLGPLRERLRGKRVGLIVCGANVHPEVFGRYVARGHELAA